MGERMTAIYRASDILAKTFRLEVYLLSYDE
jgi:hypothetical protein